MKKASRYIPSLILSVILVFSVIGAVGASVFSACFTRANAKKIAEKNDTGSIVYSQLESYFKEKQHSSGIPAEVYMDGLSESKLKEIIEYKINEGFDIIENKIDNTGNYFELTGVNSNLTEFFNNYADENKIEKDEAFFSKLNSTIEAADKTIQNYCDVYKLDTLENQGILSKIAKLSKYVLIITAVLVIAVLLIVVLLLLVNIGEKISMLYWFGISTLIAGIMGAVPCAYLLATNFFKSFTIKQPQVFSVYTSAMTGFTKVFMTAMILTAVLGIILLFIHSLGSEKNTDK